MNFPVCLTSGRFKITISFLLLSAALGAHAQGRPGSVADTQCADGTWHTGYYDCGANGGTAPASNAPRPLTREEIEARNRDAALKYNAAGNAAILRNDYATAIADYQAALNLYHGGFLGDSKQRATLRNNLALAMCSQALIAFQQGNYAAAISEYWQALSLIPDYKKTKNYKQIQANIALAQQRLAAQQAPYAPLAPAPLVRIGGAGAVKGPVFAVDAGRNQVPILSGTPIYSNEHIVTGAGGHLQVMLLDETTFTMGPGSDMVLDEFVYDPQTTVGKVTARLTKGVFRFVSGKVAGQGPDRMKIVVPAGAIGIRGTDVETKVNPDNSGYVKLFSGQADITENKSGAVISMDAGEKVTFSADGTFSRPHR